MGELIDILRMSSAIASSNWG